MNDKNSEISKMKKAVSRVTESETAATEATGESDHDLDMDGETEEYVAEMIADCLADLPDEVGRIESFSSAGVMTKNVGIVLSMTSGKTFHVQVVKA